MRISDLSSDVCSSDLIFIQFTFCCTSRRSTDVRKRSCPEQVRQTLWLERRQYRAWSLVARRALVGEACESRPRCGHLGDLFVEPIDPLARQCTHAHAVVARLKREQFRNRVEREA